MQAFPGPIGTWVLWNASEACKPLGEGLSAQPTHQQAARILVGVADTLLRSRIPGRPDPRQT